MVFLTVSHYSFSLLPTIFLAEFYSVAQDALELSASLPSVGIIGTGHCAQLATTILKKLFTKTLCQGCGSHPHPEHVGVQVFFSYTESEAWGLQRWLSG